MPFATSLKSVQRIIETPILSLRAAPRFFGNSNLRTTRRAQLAFGKKTLRKPSNATQARQNAAPGRLLPGGVRDELRSSGCHRPNIERMVRPSCFGGSIERMVYDVYHSGSCMIQRGSRAVAILQNHSLIPFKFETRMTPGRARTAAPLGNSRTRAGAASNP